MAGILQQPPSLGLLRGERGSRDDLGPSEWLCCSLRKGSMLFPCHLPDSDASAGGGSNTASLHYS